MARYEILRIIASVVGNTSKMFIGDDLESLNKAHTQSFDGHNKPAPLGRLI